MSKLFDENEGEHIPMENLPENLFTNNDPEDDEEYVHVFRRDKIFNNDYNTGNLEFEDYDLPKVDTFYAGQNLNDCYDSHEYLRKKKLEELVHLYFRESDHCEILMSKKKIPKQTLPIIFSDIREKFVKNEYTNSEIFTTIADYFGLNYELLYENIPSIYREQLVKELDDKHLILKKRGLKRLF